MDGEWHAAVRVPNGRQYDARLVIQGEGGTWKLGVGGADPCVSMAIPVQWHPADAGAVEISFFGSKALTGCRDSRTLFQPMEGGAFKGRGSGGVEIVLTRQAKS